LSATDRRRPRTRATTSVLHAVLLVFFLVVGLGPLLWLAQSAITPTQDTLRMPLALFPHGVDLQNLVTAWTKVRIGHYVLNTLAIALGAWLSQLVVATTAGYALSVLRPRYAGLVSGLVLMTLFVPAVVLLVPLYLVILDPPLLGQSLVNSFWAVWLPAGASAFNVLLVKRFFDSLSRDVFAAARMGSAGPVSLHKPGAPQ